jgi:sigma-E factor negative regulatory protein RseB
MISMRRKTWSLQLIVVCFALVALSARADNGDALTDKQTDKQNAQAWLKKIQLAAQKLNYSGTFFYQQANQISMSRITHVLDGKNEFDKLEILDGKPREYIRRNDDVACYMPETRTIMLEKGFTQKLFPALLAVNSAELTEHYDISKVEGGRVAGFDCLIITLQPKDNLRYGYRLWAERNSGLLLRAQTVNERSEVVEQITFAQLMIGGIDRNSVRPSFPNTASWHVEISPMMEASLTGWSVTAVPPGFKKIHEFKRMVSDSSPNPVQGAVVVQHEVGQMVFSDGLAAISVFVEPGSQSRTEGSMQQGAMNIIGKRQGDYWLTIVGEVPAAAIRNVANSIEFKSK